MPNFEKRNAEVLRTKTFFYIILLKSEQARWLFILLIPGSGIPTCIIAQ